MRVPASSYCDRLNGTVTVRSSAQTEASGFVAGAAQAEAVLGQNALHGATESGEGIGAGAQPGFGRDGATDVSAGIDIESDVSERGEGAGVGSFEVESQVGGQGDGVEGSVADGGGFFAAAEVAAAGAEVEAGRAVGSGDNGNGTLFRVPVHQDDVHAAARDVWDLGLEREAPHLRIDCGIGLSEPAALLTRQHPAHAFCPGIPPYLDTVLGLGELCSGGGYVTRVFTSW